MIRIGTSGYNYPEWRGTFYPEKFPTGKMLPYYAERFSTVEINYTFYRMPNAKTVAGWVAGGTTRVGTAEQAQLEKLGVRVIDASAQGWGIINHDLFLSNDQITGVIRRAIEGRTTDASLRQKSRVRDRGAATDGLPISFTATGFAPAPMLPLSGISCRISAFLRATSAARADRSFRISNASGTGGFSRRTSTFLFVGCDSRR